MCGMKLLIHSQTSTVPCWSLGMNKSFHPTFCHYLPMLWLRLSHTGDFTKYGQPVPRPDPTQGVRIAHFQLWGWRYPSCAQTVPFFSAWIYFPNAVKKSINPRDSYMHHWPGPPLTWVMASVAVNYRYRRYKSIWKFRSTIDMDFSISIYRVSNLTSAIKS